jgi:uncharacterized membrane protein
MFVNYICVHVCLNRERERKQEVFSISILLNSCNCNLNFHEGVHDRIMYLYQNPPTKVNPNSLQHGNQLNHEIFIKE